MIIPPFQTASATHIQHRLLGSDVASSELKGTLTKILLVRIRENHPNADEIYKLLAALHYGDQPAPDPEKLNEALQAAVRYSGIRPTFEQLKGSQIENALLEYQGGKYHRSKAELRRERGASENRRQGQPVAVPQKRLVASTGEKKPVDYATSKMLLVRIRKENEQADAVYDQLAQYYYGDITRPDYRVSKALDAVVDVTQAAPKPSELDKRAILSALREFQGGKYIRKETRRADQKSGRNDGVKFWKDTLTKKAPK